MVKQTMKKIVMIVLFALVNIVLFGSNYLFFEAFAINGHVFRVTQYSLPEFRACVAVTEYNQTASTTDFVNIISSDTEICSLLSQALISNGWISFQGDQIPNPPPRPEGGAWEAPLINVWKVTLFGYN